MYQSLNNAGLFLITILFDLYLFVLGGRLLLAWVRADYNNPLTRFIDTLTTPVITRLRRILPNYRNLETSTLVLILFLEIIKLFLVGLLLNIMPDVFNLLLFAILSSIKLILNIFFYVILIYAILSWIQPGYSPVSQMLAQMSSPILRPLQRIVPLIAGIDLTPLIALILLQLIMVFL